MRSRLAALLTVSILSISACSETAPPSAPPPPPAAAPEPPPAPAPLLDAPKAMGSLTMISSSDIKALLGQPLDASPAAAELVRRDAASTIAGRCAPIGAKAGKGHETAVKIDEVEAETLKIGMIPTAVPRDLANQMIEKTRLWQVSSPEFDFYKTLSDGNQAGLKPDRAAVSCIRLSLFRSGLYADMIFSVTHNPKKPEILTVMPVRVFYRDFPSLADQPGAAQAAVKVTLDMKSYSRERTSGRVASAMANQEMLVELFADPGAGQPVYQLYDPINGPSATIALPPWDFSAKSVDPQHNLSMLNINLTEIADFGWLAGHAPILWPGWEAEATDVTKLRRSAAYYRRTHLND